MSPGVIPLHRGQSLTWPAPSSPASSLHLLLPRSPFFPPISLSTLPPDVALSLLPPHLPGSPWPLPISKIDFFPLIHSWIIFLESVSELNAHFTCSKN